jgi:hypothetical protein
MQFPYILYVRPDHGRLTSRRFDLNCELALRISTSGWESMSSRRLQQSSHICVWNEILKLDRNLRVVQMGCWNVRTDGSWSSSKLLDIEEGPDENPRRPDGWCIDDFGVRTVWHIVRMVGALDSWVSGRDDTSSGRLTGSRIFWLANCAESSENTSE